MKNRIKLKRPWFGLYVLLFVTLFSSCEQKMDEYYEIPTWLKGNAWEVLEKRGDFTLFLEAVEQIGFRSMMDGKGIVTVVAPNDDAMKVWLSEKGYASLNDVPKDELSKVIAYHLMYYSFSKSMLENYRPEGKGTTDTITNAGLYYKFRTKSSDSISIEMDHTVSEGDPVGRRIYHKERFLPIFSSKTFATLGIDAKTNYEYFYPNSTWNGATGGINISNASVVDYGETGEGIVTDNGYVFIVDRVLEPLETVYNLLLASDNFSTFAKMYDRFAYFAEDVELTTNYGNGEPLYQKYYLELPQIASEWTYNGETSGIPDYAGMDKLSRVAYNVFAPSNTAMQTFFDSFWAPYYSSIDEIPFIPAIFLLYNHVSQGNIVFPQTIREGKIVSSYGNVIQFDTDQTSLRKMCVNGSLYGLDNVAVPAMFRSVTAPLFQDPAYTYFLHLMATSNLIVPLMSEDVDLALFIPTDHVMEDNTTVRGGDTYYAIGNKNQYGVQDIILETSNGPTSMSLSLKREIGSNHIGASLVSSVGDKKIYKTLNSFQYLLVENNSRIYSSDTYNNYPEDAAFIEKKHEAYNGVAYEVHGDMARALLPDWTNFTGQILNNPPEEYIPFKDLVNQSKIANSVPAFDFLQQQRFIVLIPSEDALQEAELEGVLPVGDQPALAEYLKCHFIDVNSSGLNDYPFPGTGISKEVNSFRYSQETYAPYKLKFIDAGDKLQIQGPTGKIVNVVGIFPHIYADGAAYLIDDYLEFK